MISRLVRSLQRMDLAPTAVAPTPPTLLRTSRGRCQISVAGLLPTAAGRRPLSRSFSPRGAGTDACPLVRAGSSVGGIVRPHCGRFCGNHQRIVLNVDGCNRESDAITSVKTNGRISPAKCRTAFGEVCVDDLVAQRRGRIRGFVLADTRRRIRSILGLDASRRISSAAYADACS